VEANKENPKAIEESPIELLTKEIAALNQKWNASTARIRDTLPQLAPIRRNQSRAEAKETEGDGETKATKDMDKDKDKDNEEEEEDNEEEEEVTNLLLTTANTASISHPLSGSTTAEEEEAEEDAVAPMPSVTRATTLTPATAALTLATTDLVRLATPLTRTSTTAGLRETRPGKWVPHSHFPGRRQHYQQQQQQLCCQHVEDYHGHLLLRRGTSRRRPTPSTSDFGRTRKCKRFICHKSGK
jgi:hypothetical protein